MIDFKKMTDEELQEFWHKNHRAGWQASVKVLGYRVDHPVTALHSLANYASNLVAMRSCRARKDKHGVAVYKFSCLRCCDDALKAGVDTSDVRWGLL